MAITVVLIGESSSSYTAPLQEQYTTYTARSGKRGIELATQHEASIVVLDAASLGTSGTRICKSLRRAFPNCTIVHIAAEAENLDSAADAVLKHPVIAKTLINTIEELVTVPSAKTLICGPFELDIDRSILKTQSEEVPLTPKQAALIELFMRHPNQTLDRKWLMQRVWHTDYTGDTRTLSVHIRFVRKLMETNANNPQYIKTVRGVGYRFEIPINEKADH